MTRPIDHPRRCRARSSRTGLPCKRWASRGQDVCRTHGGGSPQALRSAAERLKELEPKAVRVVDQHLTKGNLRAAEVVFKATGADEPQGMVPAERVRQIFEAFTEIVLECVSPSEQLAVVTRLRDRVGYGLGTNVPLALPEPEEFTL